MPEKNCSPSSLEMVKLKYRNGIDEYLTCQTVRLCLETRTLVCLTRELIKRTIPLDVLQWWEQALLSEDGQSAVLPPKQSLPPEYDEEDWCDEDPGY